MVLYPVPRNFDVGIQVPEHHPHLAASLPSTCYINGDHVKDIMFESRRPAGTYNDVASFHDWFANLKRPPGQDPKAFPNFWGAGLLDEVFTHADLHRSNIMISRSEVGKLKVAVLIDWHQSGWYPAPWEFYKVQRTAKATATATGVDLWEMDFVLEFLDSYRGCISWQLFSIGL